MGYNRVTWSMDGRVSRHNSPNDYVDDRLWWELIDEFRSIAFSSRYIHLFREDNGWGKVGPLPEFPVDCYGGLKEWNDNWAEDEPNISKPVEVVAGPAPSSKPDADFVIEALQSLSKTSEGTYYCLGCAESINDPNDINVVLAWILGHRLLRHT